MESERPAYTGVFEPEGVAEVHTAQCTVTSKLFAGHELSADCFCRPYVELPRDQGDKLLIVHRKFATA